MLDIMFQKLLRVALSLVFFCIHFTCRYGQLLQCFSTEVKAAVDEIVSKIFALYMLMKYVTCM